MGIKIWKKRIGTILLSVALSAGFLSPAMAAGTKTVSTTKTKSTYYTAQKVANARENISLYGWAADEKNSAVSQAEVYLSMGLDELWKMVPSQNIPRSYGVNQPDGCLNCGTRINSYGIYPYRFHGDTIDWKLECPSCRVQFPTNNFKAYYEGGLDSNGNFDPVLAKQHNDQLIAKGQEGNLVNKSGLHMDDPKWGVDDGMGYGYNPSATADGGKPYTYVAYYAHWALWYGTGTPSILQRCV